MVSKSIIDALTDVEFAEIVSNSFSLTEVTKKCGFKTCNSGGGREKVKKRITMLDLDTSHFKTTGRQFEKSPHNKITNINNVLKKCSTSSRETVRDIILRNGL